MHAYLSPVGYDSETMESRSGQRRHVHRWVPAGRDAWGHLTIVHGFGDHGGRFAGMATSLASLGLSVIACDLIGHGRSPGKRGVIESYEQLLDEVEIGLEHGIALNPRIPHFLFGQSMGGNLVLNWALRRRDFRVPLLGVIAGSPMLRSPRMPKEQIMNAGRWLAERMPNLRIKTPVQVTRLSQDRRAQDAYLRDPWVHRSMSLRLAASLIDSGLWAIENAGSLATPTLLMHGTEDTLTCPKGTCEFAEKAGEMATYRAWVGCRHELYDEPQRESVFAFMTHWLKERCVASIRLPKGTVIPASVAA